MADDNPQDVNNAAAAAQVAAAAAAQNAGVNRTCAIPKFNGEPPTHQSALNWLEGASLYWGAHLNNITKPELEGFLAFAFKDAALHWYQIEHSLGDSLTQSWANFKDQFAEQWLKIKLPRATIAQHIKSLVMRPDEPIRHFRSRCLEVSLLSTLKLKPPPAPQVETDAEKALRKKTQTMMVNDNALWYFLGGLLPVIRQPLLDKDFDDLNSCLVQAKRVITVLTDTGKYKDPTLGKTLVPKESHSNMQVLNPYVASLNHNQPGKACVIDHSGSHISRPWPPPRTLSCSNMTTEACHALSVGQTIHADHLNDHHKQYFGLAVNALSKPKPSGRPSPKKKSPPSRGGDNRKAQNNTKDYTINATCSFCGIKNHTESQCWSKQKQQSGAVNALRARQPQHNFVPGQPTSNFLGGMDHPDFY